MEENSNLDLAQMSVQAELLGSLDSALQMVTILNESVIYLNFENESMIQRYYDALNSTAEGFQFLVQGFHALAESYGLTIHTKE